ncbi:MAG: LPP20 family lipoprotein [Proteobacteria bacterium]|nr:LPP20 family lipoprotein [Pseudomonadota bacterium]
MKNRFIILCILTIFISACISAPPAKNSRSVKSQHDRAQSAFDELEDRPSSPVTSEKPSRVASPPEPEPVLTKPTAPIQVSAPDFSSSRYLTAKGYGQSKPESIRQAKAELSNIFEARISSDVTSRVQQITDSVKGDSFNKSLQSQIRVVSDIQLEGVQIGDTERDNGEYMTLAALDKYNARDKWMGDIGKVDTQIDVLLSKSNSAKSKILKLLPLKKILELWVQREVALSRLRVIGFASEIEQKDLKSILMKISEIKSSMLIDIDVSGKQGTAVRDTVAEILTDNGFKVGDFESKSDVLISGSVKIDAVRNNNPRFKFSRATVSLNVIDTPSKNQVGQVSENERGAGLNDDEAAHNAVKKVSEKVSDKLVEYFN